jgi:excisionase family DNA binding protein
MRQKVLTMVSDINSVTASQITQNTAPTGARSAVNPVDLAVTMMGTAIMEGMLDLSSVPSSNRMEIITLCTRLRCGERTLDVAKQLDTALIGGPSNRLRTLGLALVQELSRPNNPPQLSWFTVAFLLEMDARSVCELVPSPNGQPVSWAGLRYCNYRTTPEAVETCLRGRYTGRPIAGVSVPNLLFEPKLTLDQAAVAIGMPRRLLRRMAHAGQVPALKLGKERFRFLRSDVDAFKSQWNRATLTVQYAVGVSQSLLQAAREAIKANSNTQVHT